MYATGLVCANCGDSYPLEARFACDRCFGPVEPGYDNAAIRREVTREKIEAGPRTLWRYADLLPVRPVAGALPVGCTPLIPAPTASPRRSDCASCTSRSRARNPTHSFKDRVVSVASAKAVELGLTALACPSTGNLAGAVAAQAAALGLRRLHLRARRPGAGEDHRRLRARRQRCSRSRATTTTSTASAPSSPYERPWAFVNVNVRAYYAQGSKTLAFETAEQLGWRLPDQIVAPIASGSLFHKVHKGFAQLIDVGLVEGEPAARSTAPRRAGCAPVAEAWDRGEHEVRPVRPDTIAKSLAIGAPGRRRQRHRRRAPHRRRHRRGARRRDRRGDRPARPHRPASSRRPPAASRSPPSRGSPARAGSTPTPAPSPTSRATA